MWDTGAKVHQNVCKDLEWRGARAGALSAYRASGSLERMEEQAIARLQTERRVWHADLDHLLEGDFAREDLELAIHLARCAAVVSSVR